jgi:hypothetical protein
MIWIYTPAMYHLFKFHLKSAMYLWWFDRAFLLMPSWCPLLYNFNYSLSTVYNKQVPACLQRVHC